MKNLFKILLFSFAVAFVACETSDSDLLSGYSSSSLNQSLYADQSSLDESFSFTAQESWSITITDASGSAVTWLSVDPTSGDAGDASINVYAESNLTGATRTAIINITCGTSSLSITIVQYAEGEDGQTPNTQSSLTPPYIKTMTVESLWKSSNGSNVSSDVYIDNYALYDVNGLPTSFSRSYYNDSDNVSYVSFEYGAYSFSSTENGSTTTFILNSAGNVENYSKSYSSGATKQYIIMLQIPIQTMKNI